MLLVLIFLIVVAVGATVFSTVTLTAWRRERLRARLLAERLVVEGRIEALTVQTLQAMRQAARRQTFDREAGHALGPIGQRPR